MKMEHEKQCLLTEEPAKFEDMNMMEYWREALSLAEERQDEGKMHFAQR